MPTVIAFANQKGGVGKTTIATQFAYYLRLQKKKKVLFLDMDAQGSASETLNERNPIAGTTSQALFREELDGVNVDKTPRGIDLIGSNQSPEAYDVESLPLAQVLNPRKWLAPILGNYDYVVIDCPPSLGRRLAVAWPLRSSWRISLFARSNSRGMPYPVSRVCFQRLFRSSKVPTADFRFWALLSMSIRTMRCSERHWQL